MSFVRQPFGDDEMFASAGETAPQRRREPRLRELLAEPAVRALMRADGLTAREIVEACRDANRRRVREQFRSAVALPP